MQSPASASLPAKIPRHSIREGEGSFSTATTLPDSPEQCTRSPCCFQHSSPWQEQGAPAQQCLPQPPSSRGQALAVPARGPCGWPRCSHSPQHSACWGSSPSVSSPEEGVEGVVVGPLSPCWERLSLQTIAPGLAHCRHLAHRAGTTNPQCDKQTRHKITQPEKGLKQKFTEQP